MDLDNYSAMLNSKPEEVEKKSSYNKKQQDDFYKDKNIVPRTIDTSKFKNTDKKYFAIADNGNVPEEYKKLMLATCSSLFKKGFIYRSVGSDKNEMDKAIRGLDNAKVEIYKLWPKANTDDTKSPVASDSTTRASYEVACAYHKRFLTLSKDIVRCYFARETQILLGKDLDLPIDLLLVYTPCGSNSFGKTFDIKNGGGVWFSFKITKEANISVFNIRNKNFLTDIKAYIAAVNNGNGLDITVQQPSAVQEAVITTPAPVQQETNYAYNVSTDVDDLL